ncbi:hypothetical protein [Streptomyces sp. NRRL B-24085]|uniref:hypothetical protein n=1 Tax=Streptomyces sp. NRRL B-24085 TaxID=1709476 RepID=UPI000A7AF133|nr:hypothetical protein [Streptomyces sp. NRRL B-24085]
MSLVLPYDVAAVRELVVGRCVLLMGAAGAGKSTLAGRLAAVTAGTGLVPA